MGLGSSVPCGPLPPSGLPATTHTRTAERRAGAGAVVFFRRDRFEARSHLIERGFARPVSLHSCRASGAPRLLAFVRTGAVGGDFVMEGVTHFVKRGFVDFAGGGAVGPHPPRLGRAAPAPSGAG